MRVTSWPPKGSGRGGGDTLARSAALLQALEVGTVRIAGHLPNLEQHAVSWQAGQHQPDSLAEVVMAYDVLVYAAAAHVTIAAPITGRLGQGGRSAIPDIGGGRVLPMSNPWARRVGGR